MTRNMIYHNDFGWRLEKKVKITILRCDSKNYVLDI